jgi:alpha-N-arabinofuranosidase
MSEGGAYVHNLMAGRLVLRPELGRSTPFLKPHSTEVAGLRNIHGGDDRFLNNLVVGPAGLDAYDQAEAPVRMEGNHFLKGARPSSREAHPTVDADLDPALRLVEKGDGWYLDMTLDTARSGQPTRRLVTTELLGRARIPDLPYERPEGTPLRVDVNYFGQPRPENDPEPGPFEGRSAGPRSLKVW